MPVPPSGVLSPSRGWYPPLIIGKEFIGTIGIFDGDVARTTTAPCLAGDSPAEFGDELPLTLFDLIMAVLPI